MINKNKLVKTIKELTNLDPLKESRETKIVEIRSLCNHILNNYYGLGCTKISRFYKEHGKNINHATILHSLRMWDIYSKDKNCSYLNDWLHELLEGDQTEDIMKISYIKSKLEFVDENTLNQVYKKVKKEYKKQLEEENEIVN
jgi:hypothetical protein|tara:strand:+ start:636 stop:1064 length:429 start_codon:yes stop_codon:yes gene_type:complete